MESRVQMFLLKLFSVGTEEVRWRLCYGFELHFSHWCWESCQNWWNYECWNMHACTHVYMRLYTIGEFMVRWRVKVCWSANNNIAKNFQTTVPMSQIQLCSSTVLIHSHQHYTEPQCFVEVRKLLKVLSSRRSLGMWENQRKRYFRNPILEISFGL